MEVRVWTPNKVPGNDRSDHHNITSLVYHAQTTATIQSVSPPGHQRDSDNLAVTRIGAIQHISLKIRQK